MTQKVLSSPLHYKEFPNNLTLHCTTSLSLGTQMPLKQFIYTTNCVTSIQHRQAQH